MLNMDVPNTSVIFCQSAICVGATLVCYENEKRAGNNVIIIVRNAEAIYKFLIYLHLDANIYWFDNFVIKKSSIFNKKEIYNKITRDINSLGLSKMSISRVFFTSVCNDLLMGCYLTQFDREKIFKLQTDVYIKNNLDDYNITIIKAPLKTYLLKIFYSFVLQYKIRIQEVGSPVFAIDIGFYRYPLINGSSRQIYNNYLYIPKTKDSKNALVYASDYTPSTFPNRDNYVSVFVRCIQALQQKGYDVYVKGHPRLGVLKESLIGKVTEIPAYIPSEFIDHKSFSCAIGLMTAAICSSSYYISSYSLLPISGLAEDERYKGWCNYLDKTSENQVKYLYSFDDL